MAKVPTILRVDEAIEMTRDVWRNMGFSPFPRPDLFWDIDVGSAVGRVMYDRMLSCARGKRGAEARLVAFLGELVAGKWCGPLVGSIRLGEVPDAPETVAIGVTRHPGTRFCSGFAIWFRDPGLKVLPCPAVTQDHRLGRQTVFHVP